MVLKIAMMSPTDEAGEAVAAVERVLTAARALSRRHGGEFTMAQLARGAGMSRATLYRRVGGREAVLATLRREGAAPRTIRDRLMTATLELVGERGPLGFALEEVASRAGASVTTIYREFGERDGLLRAALTSMAPQAALRGLLADEQAPLRATLEGFVAAAIARLEAQPLLLRILFTPDAASWQYMQRVRAQEARLSRSLVRYFAAQQQRGRVVGESPEQLATALFGLVLGDLMRGRLEQAEGGRAGTPARARGVVAVFLGGVGRPARKERAR